MSEWVSTTLGEIALNGDSGLVDGPFGSNLPARHYTDSGIPVIRGSNLTLGQSRFNSSVFVYVSTETAERLERSLCEANDIIFTKKGTLGQTGLVPKDSKHKKYLLSSNQMRLRVNTGRADPFYVYYYVSSPESRAKIVRDAESTGVPKTNLSYLRDFPIMLPDLPSQRRIAHILGTLDDKIELNRRMNRTLEAIARAIFKSWFIDFDPVHAKAEGREPVGMDPETAALFPNSFQDSPLGQIPKGWDVESLNGVLELSRESIKPQEHPEEVFDHFSIPAYDAGGPALEFGETIRSSKYEVPPFAVLISKINPHIPRVWLPHVSEDRRSICSTEFLVCVPKEGVSREYIYSLLSSTAFLGRFAQLVTGTTGSHQRVRPTAFLKMDIVVPPQDLREAFARSIGLILHRCAALLIESSELVAILDALLPRLLSGKLELTNEGTAL
jgi:type I restriction enzyme S subunit